MLGCFVYWNKFYRVWKKKKKKRRKSVVEPLMVLENKVVSSCWVLASGFFTWHMGVSNNIYVKDFEF